MRSKVTFIQHNLLDTPPRRGPFDIIFLRNVLIYFDLETRREVLRRLRSVLRPGGFLQLGTTEAILGIDDGWERVAVGRGSVFRVNARGAP